MLITQSTVAPNPGSLLRDLGEDGYYRTFSGNHPVGLPGIDLAAIGHWLARHLATAETGRLTLASK